MDSSAPCPIPAPTEHAPATPDDLFAVLADLGIAVSTHTHAPLFRVEDGLEIEKNIPGTHCRNLFLKDKKDRMFLVTAMNETKIDLKKLGLALGATGRLSFGSADRLLARLGVTPGSVCPFAMMNDHGHHVAMILDKDMMERDRVNYHPLINTMTIGLSPDDLLVFLRHFGHNPIILDMNIVAPAVTAEPHDL